MKDLVFATISAILILGVSAHYFSLGREKKWLWEGWDGPLHHRSDYVYPFTTRVSQMYMYRSDWLRVMEPILAFIIITIAVIVIEPKEWWPVFTAQLSVVLLPILSIWAGKWFGRPKDAPLLSW
jgi:hypothetical protein